MPQAGAHQSGRGAAQRPHRQNGVCRSQGGGEGKMDQGGKTEERWQFRLQEGLPMSWQRRQPFPLNGKLSWERKEPGGWAAQHWALWGWVEAGRG